MRILPCMMPSSKALQPCVTHLSVGNPPVIHQHLHLPSCCLLQFSLFDIQRRRIGLWSIPSHNIPYRPSQLQGCATNMRIVLQIQGCDSKTRYWWHLQGITPRKLFQQLIILHAVPGPTREQQNYLSICARGPNYSKLLCSLIPKLPNGTSPRPY